MTNQYSGSQSPASLLVMEGGKLSVCFLNRHGEWIVGRGDGISSAPNMLLLHTPIASRMHGWLRERNGYWYYTDNPENTNGTLYNGIKVSAVGGASRTVMLNEGDILRIDSQSSASGHSGAVMMVFTQRPVDSGWERFPLQGRSQVTIGRSPQSDIVLALPYLSAIHAQITCGGGHYYLSDCGSKAGTWLNHQRIGKNTPLKEKDCFHLADQVFFLVGDSLIFSRKRSGAVAVSGDRSVILRANIRAKRVKDNSGTGTKELLRDVQLEIRKGTLVAMLGTAGAGKTTVMNCLNGMDLQGVTGTVMYQGVDLMRNFAQVKSLIGSVPQQKTFHRTFTPEQEFRFAAKKRLPGDTTNAEIRERVNKTLDMLSIQGVRKSRNCKLSGGEQTRVNVGIELVADRDLLCLDEPDQGLSPNYKRELFEILRRLAHESGKTMLTIIHDVSEIDMFDQVIILAKKDGVGRLAFSGSPQEARQHFGCEIRDIYTLLDKHPERYIR